MSRSRDEICTKTLLNGFNKTPTKSDYSQWYLRFWFSKTTEIHSSQWLRFFAVFCSLDPQAYHRWPSGCPAPSPGGFSRWEKNDWTCFRNPSSRSWPDFFSLPLTRVGKKWHKLTGLHTYMQMQLIKSSFPPIYLLSIHEDLFTDSPACLPRSCSEVNVFNVCMSAFLRSCFSFKPFRRFHS